MSHYETEFARVVGVEGRYANDPNDSGGETMYGITVAVARRHGYTGPMNQMPLSVAHSICRVDYWDAQRLESIALLSPKIAGELFDSGVNCGIGNSGRWLQRALNVFNLRGAYYSDVVVDGSIGPATLSAYAAYFAKRGKHAEIVLYRALNAQQGAYYQNLAEERPKDEDFVFGWFLNRVQ